MLDAGVKKTEVYLKIPISHIDTQNQSNYLLELVTNQLLPYLKQQNGFNTAKISKYGSYGNRSGSTIRGRHYINIEEVKFSNTNYDYACRCSWPIEFWDLEKGVQLESTKQEGSFSIPDNSLRVKRIHNVFAAGRNISCDAYVQSAIRVTGCCWAMGEAAARLSQEV